MNPFFGDPMDPLRRNQVNVRGQGTPTLMFSHGFGCDQNMWRFVTPAFEARHQVVLFDHVGSGQSDLSAYDRRKYGTLDGYATDVLEILAALDLRDVVFVGHSVSAMIGTLAANREPERFRALIHVGPSPRYVNDGDYVGGFERKDIDELLDFMDANYLGWAQTLAPLIVGRPDRPELTDELTHSFCRTDPAIARHFARVTFLSDNRADLAKSRVPTLLLQVAEDAIAPRTVGEYLRRHVANSELVVLDTTGHCPHLSAPDQTIAAMRRFLEA